MNIIEAVKSGKRFRRKNSCSPWLHPACIYYEFTSLEILADDWEVEEKKVEITLRDLCVAWDNARKNLCGGGVPFADHIAKELGFLD